MNSKEIEKGIEQTASKLEDYLTGFKNKLKQVGEQNPSKNAARLAQLRVALAVIEFPSTKNNKLKTPAELEAYQLGASLRQLQYTLTRLGEQLEYEKENTSEQK